MGSDRIEGGSLTYEPGGRKEGSGGGAGDRGPGRDHDMPDRPHGERNRGGDTGGKGGSGRTEREDQASFRLGSVEAPILIPFQRAMGGTISRRDSAEPARAPVPRSASRHRALPTTYRAMIAPSPRPRLCGRWAACSCPRQGRAQPTSAPMRTRTSGPRSRAPRLSSAYSLAPQASASCSASTDRSTA